jgi:hypothetical protein
VSLLVTIMWFVLLVAAPGGTTIRASVVGPMSRATYTQRYGTAPVVGPNGYHTKIEAAAAAANYNHKPAGQRVTGGLPADPSIATGPGGVHIPGISNPLAGVNAIGDFFNRLTQPNTWVRVGEVVAGVLLLYLGLSATMRGTEAGKQINKAKSVAKTAAGVAIK